MNDNRKPRGFMFSVAVAIVLICAATALACSAIIVFRSCSIVSSASSKTFYAVGKLCDRISIARGQSAAERAAGRAGYVLATDDGFMLVYAVYSWRGDATVVSERLGAGMIELSARPSSFEDGREAEALDTLSEIVSETEKLWRALDEGTTSESLTVKQLNAYATAVAAYKSLPNVGGLCDEISVHLRSCAAGGEYPLTADVKYVSALTAARLDDFTRKDSFVD